MDEEYEAVVTNNSTENKQKAKAIKSPLKYTLAVQLLVVVPALVVLNVFNPLWMQAFFLGTCLYSVPNAYFTWYAFRFRGAKYSQWIAKSFYQGEMGKHMLAAVGFALVFRFVTPLHLPSLIAGFCSFVVLQWLIAWQIADRFEQTQT